MPYRTNNVLTVETLRDMTKNALQKEKEKYDAESQKEAKAKFAQVIQTITQRAQEGNWQAIVYFRYEDAAKIVSEKLSDQHHLLSDVQRAHRGDIERSYYLLIDWTEQGDSK